MTTWWLSLPVPMRILWGITIASTLIFVIQSILTFIGADADTDFDADLPADGDAGGDGMNLYTFRNLIHFLLGFGWTSVLMYGSVTSKILLFLLAAVVGVLFVLLTMLLFKWLGSMQQSGTIQLQKSATGCRGKVYLTVPAARSGVGKVQISINNAVREYDAMTDEVSPLATGTPICVDAVLDDSTLLVSSLKTN